MPVSTLENQLNFKTRERIIFTGKCDLTSHCVAASSSKTNDVFMNIIHSIIVGAFLWTCKRILSTTVIIDSG